MDIRQAAHLRPVAEPRVIEDAYSEDQHRRLLALARSRGPWKLIIAHHFQSAEELIATTSGSDAGRRRRRALDHVLDARSSADFSLS